MSSFCPVAQSTVTLSNSNQWNWDERYYLEDGDCVLLAENTLFKIPKALLVCLERLASNAPAFRAKFGHPNDAGSVARFSDESPLEFHDSTDDIRALCWALTAFPATIAAQCYPSTVQIGCIISIFHVGHKYRLDKFEKWAGDLLTIYSARNDCEKVFERCTIDQLKKVLFIASHSTSTPTLVADITSLWFAKLSMNPALSTKDALDFAERTNNRTIQGRIYYLEVERMLLPDCAWDSIPPIIRVTLPKNEFSDSQSLQLYRGFFLLSAYWEGLKTPGFLKDTTQGHQNTCLKNWHSMWEHRDMAVLAPLKRLRAFYSPKEADNTGIISSDCEFCAKHANHLHQQLLADFFLGPPTASGPGHCPVLKRHHNRQVLSIVFYKEFNMSEEPPAKRPRTSTAATSTTASSQRDWKRDEKYYQEEGDCVILVDKTLFKIPRILLTRASSVFQDMFTLPHDPGVDMESLQDGNPLRLHDSVEDFRALCWALTAFPAEISAQNDPSKVKIRRLVSLFHIANKYQFTEFETWAGDMLKQFSSLNIKYRPVFSQCTIEDLKRILLVGRTTSNNQLLANCARKWLDRLENDASLSTKEALDFAETISYRYFEGHIYYQEVKRMKVPLHTVDPTTIAFPQNGFSEAQTLRLYRGFWLLSAFWESLRKPPIQQNDQQDHKTNCLQEWQGMWSRDDQNNTLLDPLKILLTFSQSKDQALNRSRAGVCGCKFKQHADTIYRKLYAAMADYFLGPLHRPSAPPNV
ncbi:unnamed protein product [Cyclocybe aegerita]|uniref:BTB domain-containing protein n=1 Tax=Cyclocybe aegerita TaxID=1973307 RepID=A0A8S0WZN9_CYCAE|nr:unnamed protein product [Cyclocybe aegerita]